MDSPFFSIIIPTYNSERIIQKSLDSVMHQTFSNFEILVMDNISTDKTLEIARTYGQEKIRIFSKKDNGIYDAMNKAIKLAKGEWLYFLGSDDTLYSPEILRNVAAQCTEAIDVLYGNVFSARLNCIHDGEFNESKILRRNICHQAIFYRRALFDKVGSYDLHYKIHADWDFNMRWFLSKIIRYQYTDLIIAHYAEGFSSSRTDPVFKREKGIKYLLYSRDRFSMRKRMSLLLKEIKGSLKNRNFSQVLYYLAHAPRILLPSLHKEPNKAT